MPVQHPCGYARSRTRMTTYHNRIQGSPLDTDFLSTFSLQMRPQHGCRYGTEQNR